MQTLNEKIEKEKRELLGGGANKTDSTAASSGSKSKNWAAEEITHLIKAVNLFPAGTNNRLETLSQLTVFVGIFSSCLDSSHNRLMVTTGLL